MCLWPNSEFVGNLTHKQISDWQHSACFKNLQKRTISLHPGAVRKKDENFRKFFSAESLRLIVTYLNLSEP